MQPSIISPVPTITFDSGEVTITAVFHSEYGAPMEDAEIGVRTPTTQVLAETTIIGETIIGVASVEDIEAQDSTWSLGEDLTIVAKTKEQGEWSETRYTAKTCGNPTVAIATGGSTIPSFPHQINWTYSDYDGFFQNRYELTMHTALMGDVVISEYSASHTVEISGDEIAYAAAINGTESTIQCSLTVYSTSGLSKTMEFSLSVTANSSAASVEASLTNGNLAIDSYKAFFLYALYADSCDQCAYSESGYLDFLLPVSGVRYFAVSLNSSRIGRADEITIGTFEPCGYIDYSDNGVLRRLENYLNGSESMKQSIDYEICHFAGRINPVSYYRNSTQSFSVGFSLEKDVNIPSLLETLRGIEAVYRSVNGGIYRVFISDVDSDTTSGNCPNEISLTLEVIDGSPYKMFYDSPFFKNAQLYPGENTFPSPTTWMVG